MAKTAAIEEKPGYVSIQLPQATMRLLRMAAADANKLVKAFVRDLIVETVEKKAGK